MLKYFSFIIAQISLQTILVGLSIQRVFFKQNTKVKGVIRVKAATAHWYRLSSTEASAQENCLANYPWKPNS